MHKRPAHLPDTSKQYEKYTVIGYRLYSACALTGLPLHNNTHMPAFPMGTKLATVNPLLVSIFQKREPSLMWLNTFPATTMNLDFPLIKDRFSNVVTI